MKPQMQVVFGHSYFAKLRKCSLSAILWPIGLGGEKIKGKIYREENYHPHNQHPQPSLGPCSRSALKYFPKGNSRARRAEPGVLGLLWWCPGTSPGAGVAAELSVPHLLSILTVPRAGRASPDYPRCAQGCESIP